MIKAAPKSEFVYNDKCLPLFALKRITLLDMVRYEVDKIVHVVAALDYVKENAVQKRWNEASQKAMREPLEKVLPILEAFGLGATHVLVRQLIGDLSALKPKDACVKADCVRQTLEADLKARILFAVGNEDNRFVGNRAFAGDHVRDTWPEANQELIEAANCFAFGQYKACAFHCCLAMESGLVELGKRLRVKKQNDWGGWIREIRNALTRRFTPRANRKRALYAQFAEKFDAIRIGRRNPTSHFGMDSYYTRDEALEVLNSTGAFIRLLADNLK